MARRAAPAMGGYVVWCRHIRGLKLALMDVWVVPVHDDILVGCAPLAQLVRFGYFLQLVTFCLACWLLSQLATFQTYSFGTVHFRV